MPLSPVNAHTIAAAFARAIDTKPQADIRTTAKNFIPLLGPSPALWDGSNGGTANCIRYAAHQGVPVVILWKEWKR